MPDPQQYDAKFGEVYSSRDKQIVVMVVGEQIDGWFKVIYLVPSHDSENFDTWGLYVDSWERVDGT